MTNKLLDIIYLGIAMLTVLVIYYSAPAVPEQPHGMLLPLKQFAAQPKTTLPKVYNGVVPGGRYETLAAVHVQYHFAAPTEQVALTAIQYAQELAATVGANGLLIEVLVGDANKVLILNAKAIK